MFFIQVAETQVKKLKGLVATEESVNNFEQIKVIAQLILGQPELAHFIVRFEAAKQLVESFSRNHVGVQVELSQSHSLNLIQSNKVGN